MTFQAILPTGGVTGWRLLNRTKDMQTKVLAASPETRNLTEYFKKNIGNVKTPDDLVDDRRLLTVALTAFGLEGDVNSKAFIRKVLSEGTVKQDAFANRLADKRYLQLAQAFGFKDFPIPRTQLAKFPDEMITKFVDAKFQQSVGDQDSNMRLALTFASNVSGVLGSQTSADGRWFAVMGNIPMRKVMESALGLPSSFGRLSLDQQLNGFRNALERTTGQREVAALADPAVQDKLVRNFLIRSQSLPTSASSILGILRR